jgi:diguanylate cyclase (GGDEF)-like protein
MSRRRLSSKSFCERFNITEQARSERIAMLGFANSDNELAQLLQADVISGNAQAIIDAFYVKLLAFPDAAAILANNFEIAALKKTQLQYLLGFGRGFATLEYFEQRLRIGHMHLLVGVRPNTYLCAYAVLHQLIADSVPSQHPHAAALLTLIRKVAHLDMALAIEAYEDTMVERMESSLASLQKETSRLSERIATDTLTGVQSRERILSLLHNALEKASPSHPLSIAMADLDHFKLINDTHGHTFGDRVLVDVAQRMRNATRRVNAVGRYGGEEFLFVLADTGNKQARDIAERIRSRVNFQPININGTDLNVTVSIGVASTTSAEDAVQLISRADEALYRAKNKGRNRVEWQE